jgi:NAD(P)-dependent dehydrogenase (short-subunit alcohol dehydrogenase family)
VRRSHAVVRRGGSRHGLPTWPRSQVGGRHRARAGARASFAATDAAYDAQVAALVVETVEAYGGLNILVNCAYSQEVGSGEELSEAGWHRSIDAMLKSTWLCARHAVPAIRGPGGGAMVNLSSIQAFVLYPRRAAYAAAKGGVSALTIGFALDHGPDGIRVNAICPGDHPVG